MRKGEHYTAAEDAKIQCLRQQGVTWKRIDIELGRPPGSAQQRVRKPGTNRSDIPRREFVLRVSVNAAMMEGVAYKSRTLRQPYPQILRMALAKYLED